MEQLTSDGTNVSFILHIHVRFLSCVIRFIVLPTLSSSSSAVLLKFPNPCRYFVVFVGVEVLF